MKLPLRNILAELVLEAFGSRTALSALLMLEAYGRQARQKGSPRVPLKDLEVPRQEEALKRLCETGLLRFPAPETLNPTQELWVEMAEEFLPDLPQIHQRVLRYCQVLQTFYGREARPSEEPQAALLKGALLFNQGLFFEVHEVLETQWKQESGETKTFLQGLIQIAVAFYHLENQNHRGALLLLQEGLEKLLPYRPRFLGVELETFTAHLAACQRQLQELGPTGMGQFSWKQVPFLLWEAEA